ncbi:hypothetical protein Plec18170_000305 [Paecilomyces lecythidis]
MEHLCYSKKKDDEPKDVEMTDADSHSDSVSEIKVEEQPNASSDSDSVSDIEVDEQPSASSDSDSGSVSVIEVDEQSNAESDSASNIEVDEQPDPEIRPDPQPKVEDAVEDPPPRAWPKCERPPLGDPEPLEVKRVRIDDRGLWKPYTGMSLPEPGLVRLPVYRRSKLVPRSVIPANRPPTPEMPKNQPPTGLAASKYAVPGYRPPPLWKKPDVPTYRTYNTQLYTRGRRFVDVDRDPVDVEADERARRADHLASLREQDTFVPGSWPDDEKMEFIREINFDTVSKKCVEGLRQMPHYGPCTIDDYGSRTKDQIAVMSGALYTSPRSTDHGITIPLRYVHDSSDEAQKKELVPRDGDYVSFFYDNDWLSCARQVKIAFPRARRFGIAAMEYVQGAVNLGDTFKRRALRLFERPHMLQDRNRTKNGRLRRGVRGQTARDRERQRRRSWNSSASSTPEKHNSSTSSYSSAPSGYNYSQSAPTLPLPQTPTAGLPTSLNYQTSHMSQPHFNSSNSPESSEIEMSDSSGPDMDSSEIEMLDDSDENGETPGPSSSLFGNSSSSNFHASSQIDMSASAGQDAEMTGGSSSSAPISHTATTYSHNSTPTKSASSSVLTYGRAVRQAIITRPMSAIAKTLKLATVYKLGRAVARVTGRSRAKPSGITKPVRRGRNARRGKEDLKKKLERYPNEFVLPWLRSPKPSTPLAQPPAPAQLSTAAQPPQKAPETLLSHKRKADGRIVSTPRLLTTAPSKPHPATPTTSTTPQPAQPKPATATKPLRKIGPILDVGPLPGLAERRLEREQRRLAEGDRKLGPVRELVGPQLSPAERRLERQRRFAEGYDTIRSDFDIGTSPGSDEKKIERQQQSAEADRTIRSDFDIGPLPEPAPRKFERRRRVMDGSQKKNLAAMLYPTLVPLPEDGDDEKGPEDYPLPEDGDDEKLPEDYPLPEDDDEELRPEYIPLPERLVEPEPTAAGPAAWLQTDVPFGKPVSAVRIFDPEAVEREPAREESTYATVWRDVEEPEAQRQPPARIRPEGPAVRPLSAKWKEVLAASMAKRDNEPLATTLRGAKLTRMDLMTCYKPMAWLNDEIINGYLELVVAYLRRVSGNTGRNEKPKYHAFSTFFFSNLRQKGYAGVAKWATRAKIGGEGLLNVDTVFIPVHNSAHWTLMVVKPSSRTIEHFDSLGSLSPAYVALAKGWLRGELGQLYVDEEWNVLPSISPQQDNGSDCGVFLLSTAKSVAVGLEPLSYGAADIPLLRQKIVAELMHGGLEGEFDPAGESGELRL